MPSPIKNGSGTSSNFWRCGKRGYYAEDHHRKPLY